ncbi:alpha/beta fold hydrolase [Pseudomonadota bacterium]
MSAPLIFLPGLLCDGALWAAQAEGLADIADVHVADLTGADTMEGLARAVLDTAPERFAVAGLSMGGYVAQEIMRQAPERVTHLAFLDTNARADLPEQSERRRALVAEAKSGDFADVGAQMLAVLVHPDFAADLRDTWLGMAERVGVQGYVNQQNAIMGRKDGRVDLAAVTCPTLVLCGEDDQLTPPDVHVEMVDAIGANATLVKIPHCGHLSTLEQPDAVTQALRAWLQGD